MFESLFSPSSMEAVILTTQDSGIQIVRAIAIFFSMIFLGVIIFIGLRRS